MLRRGPFFFLWLSAYGSSLGRGPLVSPIRQGRLLAHKVSDTMTVQSTAKSVIDECHRALWRLKDPSSLAVTRVLFGED